MNEQASYHARLPEAINAVAGSVTSPSGTLKYVGWPLVPTVPTFPWTCGTPPPPKSDAPYVIATLAQLLDEGKLSEESFVRLVERVVQSR